MGGAGYQHPNVGEELAAALVAHRPTDPCRSRLDHHQATPGTGFGRQTVGSQELAEPLSRLRARRFLHNPHAGTHHVAGVEDRQPLGLQLGERLGEQPPGAIGRGRLPGCNLAAEGGHRPDHESCRELPESVNRAVGCSLDLRWIFFGFSTGRGRPLDLSCRYAAGPWHTSRSPAARSRSTEMPDNRRYEPSHSPGRRHRDRGRSSQSSPIPVLRA